MSTDLPSAAHRYCASRSGLPLRVGSADAILIGAVKVIVTLESGLIDGVPVALVTALPSTR